MAYDSDTFDAAEARQLIDLLPLARRPFFSVRAETTGAGSSTEGVAAGFGPVRIGSDSEETRVVELGRGSQLRFGEYKLTHDPGLIEISRMWADTLEDQTGQVARLRYSKLTREPKDMLIAQTRPLKLGALVVSRTSFLPWKTPEVERGSRAP